MNITIRRNPTVEPSRRYFSSARTILMLRLDPGTVDGYYPAEVRDEVAPDPYIQARNQSRFAALVGKSRASGPRTFSIDDRRAAITSARVNLADAIARLPRDELTVTISLAPQKSTRRINSYRKADELDLQYDFRLAPFDARLVRAVLVLHYEGTTSADMAAIGEAGQLPLTGDNLRFVGIAEEISDAHGDEGDIVALKARDLTALLIDTKWPRAQVVKIPPGSTIVQVIQAILKTNPAFSLIRGPFLRTAGPLPALDPARYPRLAVSAQERNRAAASGGRPFVLRMPPKAGGDSSYWDVLTDLCVSHGLRPAIELDKFVLLEPRQLYKAPPEKLEQPGVPTFPTAYRRAIGDTFPVRRMAFGINVAALRFNRKLGRIKAPTIEVSSRNPDAPRADQRLLVVRWPPKSTAAKTAKTQLSTADAFTKNAPDTKRAAVSVAQAATTGKKSTANSVDATGNHPEEKIHPVQLRGIIDRTQLQTIAQQIYEGMGRGELGVVIETDDVASYSTHPEFDPNQDPDLLALRAGDPIRLLVAPTRDASRLYTISELQLLIDQARQTARLGGQRAEYASAIGRLVAEGWDEREARRFVRCLASANLPQEFRVVGASIAYDNDAGFTVQIDARDYVHARADPDDIAQTRRLGTVVPGSPAPGVEGTVT